MKLPVRRILFDIYLRNLWNQYIIRVSKFSAMGDFLGQDRTGQDRGLSAFWFLLSDIMIS